MAGLWPVTRWVLTANVRSIDAVGRYGGDEFGVVLPATAPDGALGTAHRLRQLVAHRLPSSDPKRAPTTISAGVAAYPANGETVAQVVEAADQALYQTELAGKNGATLAPTPASA